MSTRVRDAIAYVVEDPNSDWSAAAEKAGLSSGSLSRAMREPGPAAYFSETIKALRSGLAIKAVKALEKLLGADSEYVRSEVARYLADRVAPAPSVRGPGPGFGSISIFIGPRPVGAAPTAPAVTIEHAAPSEPVHTEE